MYTPHFHLHFFKNKELNELYISIAIRSFALSMISIFTPIFLLKLNYSLRSILFFYIILYATHVIFVIPVAKIASRYGFKHLIFFSVPILIIFYLALYTLEQFHWPLYMLAIIFGINNVLYWMGYHVDFSSFSKKESRGEEIGMAKMISLIFYILGPIIGGFILTFLGFPALFITVSVLLLASIIPLFFSKDIHNPINFSIKSIFQGQDIKDALVFIGHGVETSVAFVIWPIIIFLVISNNFITLGLATAIPFVFSLLFILFIGKFVNTHSRFVLKIGAISNVFIWILKFFVHTVSHVFILDSFYRISQTLVQIPFGALSYDKANNTNIVRFIIFQEIMVQSGKIILFCLIAVTSLKMSFLFAASTSLLYLLF